MKQALIVARDPELKSLVTNPPREPDDSDGEGEAGPDDAAGANRANANAPLDAAAGAGAGARRGGAAKSWVRTFFKEETDGSSVTGLRCLLTCDPAHFNTQPHDPVLSAKGQVSSRV